MAQYRIRIGQPITPNSVREFREKKEVMKDPDLKTREKILITALMCVLVLALYPFFFKKADSISKHSQRKLQNSTEESNSETQNRQVYTGDAIQSMSTSVQSKSSGTRNTLSNEGGKRTAKSNMIVLSEMGGNGEKNQYSRLTLPPASVLEGHLDGQVVVSGSQTPIIAIVDEDFESQGKILVSKGSKLLGHSAGVQNNRVLILFDRLISPDGSATFSFLGFAQDSDKTMGIPGEVHKDSIYKMGTSLASTVLGVGMESAVGNGQSIFGQVARRTIQTTTQDLSSTMSQGMNYAGGQIVTLPPDTPIKILALDNY